jgi:hypothetical protein
MSFLFQNMKTHVSCGITGRIKSSRIKLIARIIFYCLTSSASERDVGHGSLDYCRANALATGRFLFDRPHRPEIWFARSCPLCAKSGHYALQQKLSLFDHFVGERLAMMLTTLNVITTSLA